MLNFSSFKTISIPEGNAQSISVGNTIIWSAAKLMSITATYTGGNVYVNTNLNDLTGLTIIANYSNNTTAIVTNYTLEGSILEGNNVITVIYKDKTATFDVIGEPYVLPDTYQEVSYLNASANTNSYIDLGFSFDTKAKILMEYTFLDKTVTSYPFGAAENSGTLRCAVSAPYGAKTYLYGSSGTGFVHVTYTPTENIAIQYEFVLEPGNLSITNLDTKETINDTTQGAYTMSANLFLFAQNYNGTTRYGGARQIGKFQYYDKNDKLICDLIPCYRKSDNVIGMYDLVRRTFLTNIGGGTFIKGPDVI